MRSLRDEHKQAWNSEPFKQFRDKIRFYDAKRKVIMGGCRLFGNRILRQKIILLIKERETQMHQTVITVHFKANPDAETLNSLAT